MTLKLEPGLRVAIKAILEVRSQYEHGSEGWDDAAMTVQFVAINGPLPAVGWAVSMAD